MAMLLLFCIFAPKVLGQHRTYGSDDALLVQSALRTHQALADDANETASATALNLADVVDSRTRNDVQTHSSTPVAVGVMSGGPDLASKVEALRSTWLSQFPDAIIMADREVEDLGVEAAPSKYYCSDHSSWARSSNLGLGVSQEWKARGRCTQQRFVYLLLRLREQYPEASFYFLVDDDTWINAAGIRTLLLEKDPSQPFLMGFADPYNRGFLWSGPGYLFSSEVVKRLDPTTVMTQSSLWEFSCSFRNCCDFHNCHPDDHPSILQDFHDCNRQLVETCGQSNTTEVYESCVVGLHKTDQNQCHYLKTVPEFPVPMYYEPDWQAEQYPSALLSHESERSMGGWGNEHGVDHVLSFAARRVGATLVPELHFQWQHKRVEDFGDGVCSVLAQHKLSPTEILRWHLKWGTKCQN